MRSFEIDHAALTPGIYKHSISGLVTTWDIRIKSPNKGDYLDPAVIHTIEHTLASYLRDRFGDYRIVGIFPMGCQTGFYVLTRFISSKVIYQSIVDYIIYLQTKSTIPGANERQCGQYDLQNLRSSKDEMFKYYENHLKLYDSAIKY